MKKNESKTTEAAPEEVTEPSPIDIAAAAAVAGIAPAEAPKGISEDAIAEKVQAGLRREQAIEVLKSQAAHDAELKASEKKGKA